MNSKCSNNFRWSVVLRTNEKAVWIGIASKLQRKKDTIKSYDQKAIFFVPAAGSFFHGEITEGAQNLQMGSGDEIHFIFQSKLKKFSIIMVTFGTDFYHKILSRILERPRICCRYRRRCRLFSSYSK